MFDLVPLLEHNAPTVLEYDDPNITPQSHTLCSMKRFLEAGVNGGADRGQGDVARFGTCTVDGHTSIIQEFRFGYIV
ncbi:hypothetical protein AVEN_264812-1 [Araneus ventricosus]|uniref:Uncharacterized protein n=1 Tax=Araneus ventricosus TaxID=182803 RepID=A0A4Y2E0H4_ARAVE|nr:hypothetical protein AVEN_264812-1 [Araneus ventricosus]